MKIFLRRLFKDIKYGILGFKCNDCYNYNIGDGVDDDTICYGCKNYDNKRV